MQCCQGGIRVRVDRAQQLHNIVQPRLGDREIRRLFARFFHCEPPARRLLLGLGAIVGLGWGAVKTPCSGFLGGGLLPQNCGCNRA
eukprot:13639585-Alexandrium_andersonii.AAC.1